MPLEYQVAKVYFERRALTVISNDMRQSTPFSYIDVKHRMYHLPSPPQSIVPTGKFIQNRKQGASSSQRDVLITSEAKMKIFKVTIIVIAVIFIILLLALSRYGLFASVSVSEKVVGPYLLIYKKHIGDYKNVGPVMDEMYNDLKNNYSMETTKGFGLYYDDPRQVDKAQLRSIVGYIVEGKTREDLSKVSSKYDVREYPSSKSVVAEFPYKGKISIFIGIMKVYPALGAYIKEHQYKWTPIMELYDMPNERIEYISSMNLPKEIFDDFLKSKEKELR